MSRVVVSNVQVLTAGTKYDQDAAKDGRPVPSTVVTLLVTPEDAERIALAGSVGQIMLTLRNPLDKEATETKGAHTAALMGAPDPPPVTNVVNNIPRVVNLRHQQLRQRSTRSRRFAPRSKTEALKQ
jgi:pilus assembly protein CpaB